MTVKEFMDLYAEGVVRSFKNEQKKEFSSRDFIWRAMYSYGQDYIKLLYNCEADNPFQAVHSQIGRYLTYNTEALEIIKGDEKEKSISPLGFDSETQIWIIK